MEYGRKGIDLLKEIVNHPHDSLSAYNVSFRPFVWTTRFMNDLHRYHVETIPTPQEDLVRTILLEIQAHDTQTLEITQ